MKIWNFFKKHVGKICAVSTVATVIIAGTAIAIPLTGALYTSWLVATGTGLVVSSTLAGYFIGEKNFEEQSVPNQEAYLKVLELVLEELKKTNEGHESIQSKVDSHINLTNANKQLVEELKKQLVAAEDIHSLEHTEVVEGQVDISAKISVLKNMIAELEGKTDSISVSQHSMFAKPGQPNPDNSKNQFPSVSAKLH